MGTLVYFGMCFFTIITILSIIAATWFDGWRDFLDRL